MCHVLTRDQRDKTLATPSAGTLRPASMSMTYEGSRGQQQADFEEMAEEQGLIARLVHLFKSDDLEIQFKVRFSLHESCGDILLTEGLNCHSCCKWRGENFQKEANEFDGHSLR